MLGEQLADDEVDLRARTIVGKAASIGHHAAIYRHSKRLVELIEIAHLPNDTEHQFAGARCIRMRDYQAGIYIWLEMMVDEYLTSRTVYKRLLHLVDTAGGVEVETEHQIGYLEQHVALIRVLVVTYYLICIGQPLEKVRILVGHHHCGILATLAQELSPSQR